MTLQPDKKSALLDVRVHGGKKNGEEANSDASSPSNNFRSTVHSSSSTDTSSTMMPFAAIVLIIWVSSLSLN